MTSRERGPLPAWCWPVARAAALVYGAAVRVHTRRAEERVPLRLPLPVVSVGNVTAGGTGKTPFVRWCAQTLCGAGHHPMVALRGYKARRGRSDEAMEYQALLPGVPLAVGGDRAQAIARAQERHPQVDGVILDDGFQHRRLSRDLDIVLVDATRPGLDGRLLPAGWLREPATALARAGLVVVTRAVEPGGALSALVERYHGRPPAAWCRHVWVGVDVFDWTPGHPTTHRPEPVEWLSGREVIAVAGLGNPAPFVDMLHRAGCVVHAGVLERDHAHYGSAYARALVQRAQAKGAVLATTWKDWTKLREALSAATPATSRVAPGVLIAVPRLEISFLQGEERVRDALVQAFASPR